jgi:hypothetical protein
MIDELVTSAVADTILFVAKLCCVVGIIGLMIHLVHARCRALIDAWAQQGGWDVVRCRRCLLASPFAFVPGMPVYRVQLASPSGRTRRAYVRVGNLIMSVLSDDLAVEWEG